MLEGKTRFLFRQPDASTSGTPLVPGTVDPLQKALNDKYVDKSPFVRIAEIGGLIQSSEKELAEEATKLGGSPADAEKLRQMAQAEWDKTFGKK